MSLYPLPPLMLFETHKGNWPSFQKSIYQFFLNEIDKKLLFLGWPVKCRYFEPIEGMHRSFWHLITENPSNSINDEDRIPDMRRCERIAWIPHLIKNYLDSNVACWENKRGTNTNVVLWLKSENYMVILSKRNGYYLLTTAYVHKEIKTKINLKEMRGHKDPRKS